MPQGPTLQSVTEDRDQTANYPRPLRYPRKNVQKKLPLRGTESPLPALRTIPVWILRKIQSAVRNDLRRNEAASPKEAREDLAGLSESLK